VPAVRVREIRTTACRLAALPQLSPRIPRRLGVDTYRTSTHNDAPGSTRSAPDRHIWSARQMAQRRATHGLRDRESAVAGSMLLGAASGHALRRSGWRPSVGHRARLLAVRLE